MDYIHASQLKKHCDIILPSRICCLLGPYDFQLVQQSNDTCLAYTLAAICNLLSETGISSTTGILGSSYSPLTRIGISLSVQQQLFVLLRGSLKRAENLKLKRLVASNHLAMAKFDLTVSTALQCIFMETCSVMNMFWFAKLDVA